MIVMTLLVRAIDGADKTVGWSPITDTNPGVLSDVILLGLLILVAIVMILKQLKRRNRESKAMKKIF
jgi:hypothetical protein